MTEKAGGRSTGDFSSTEMRAHIWNYFNVHANQRMSMFNFFLVLTGLLGAGLAACVQGQRVLQLLGGITGLFLSAVAFAFYKLDQRTSFLVKHAEGAMVRLESEFKIAEARIFTAEISETASRSLLSSILGMWTYGTSLRFIFLLTVLAGLGGGLLSLGRYLSWIS